MYPYIQTPIMLSKSKTYITVGYQRNFEIAMGNKTLIIFVLLYQFFTVSCRVAWKTIEGPVWTVGSLEQTFAVPESVPNDAAEILVYAVSESGFNQNQDVSLDWQIWTYDLKYNEKYVTKIRVHYKNQDAWTTNSDNIWLPLTSERKVHSLLSEFGSNHQFKTVQIIGYRYQ